MSIQNGKSAANGTAKPITPVVSLQAPKPEEQKNELSNLTVSAPPPADAPTQPAPASEQEKPTLSLDDIFYKMDMAFALRDKLGKLKETQEKLTKWKLSTDTRTDQLVLTDRNGHTFNTFSPVVVGKTVEWLKEEIALTISVCEADIRKLL